MVKSEKVLLLLSSAWLIASVPLTDSFFDWFFQGALMRGFTIVIALYPVILFYSLRWIFEKEGTPAWINLISIGAMGASAIITYAADFFEGRLLPIILWGIPVFLILSFIQYGKSGFQVRKSSHNTNQPKKSPTTEKAPNAAASDSPYLGLPNNQDLQNISYDLFLLALYGTSEIKNALVRISPRSPIPNVIFHDGDALKICYGLIFLQMNKFAFHAGGKKFIMAFAMMRSRLITVLLKVSQPHFNDMPRVSDAELETNKFLRDGTAAVLDSIDRRAKHAYHNMKLGKKPMPLTPILELARPYIGENATPADLQLAIGEDVDTLNVYIENNLKSLLKKYQHLDDQKSQTGKQ